MPLPGTYEPSPWSIVADQVELYESSSGTDGLHLEGKPCVILWTTGRKSGLVRKSALMRVNHGEQYAVVASMGGAPQSPVWYFNLKGNARVSLQDGPVLKDYTAREVEGDEKTAWWARATEVWPAYDTYQASTDRVIPLIVLDPLD